MFPVPLDKGNADSGNEVAPFSTPELFSFAHDRRQSRDKRKGLWAENVNHSLVTRQPRRQSSVASFDVTSDVKLVGRTHLSRSVLSLLLLLG